MNPKEQLAALLKSMQETVDAAKAADRDLTADEIADIEAKTSEADELQAKIDRSAKSADLVARIGEMKASEQPEQPMGGGVKAKSLGDFAAKAIGEKLAGVKGSRFQLATPEFKASSDTHTGDSSVFGPAVTDVDTRLVTGVRRRLTIADLLGSETISGSAITYFVEGALEGDFETVGQAGKKPQLHYEDPESVTEALAKIAAFIKESDEIIDDLPWFVSAINNRLVYNLGLFEEKQLLTGDGSGTNLKGILNRTGLQTESAETGVGGKDNPDAVFRAITKVALNSGLDADAIVINPLDYQKFRLSKDSNGQYFGGGFFSGEYGQGSNIVAQPPLWGLRTVVTPAVSEKTVVVGSFGQAGSVIRKGGVRVESTNTDQDDFVKNRVTIRAEERLALAVRRPSGFVKVTLDYETE